MSECAEISTKKRFLFGLSAIPDQLTYQAFTLLVFTYYYAVIGINIGLVWAAYVIWGIWNAVNDPLLGGLSDRKKFHKKLGKRKFFLTIALFPLSIMMVLLFTAPIGNELISFIYFFIIILTFELFYTMYSVNVNAVFPEMFPNEEERAKTNLFVKALTVFAVICASLIPTLIISPMVPLEKNPPRETTLHFQMMYITAGAVLMAIILISGVIFIFKGVEEQEECIEDFEKRPSFLESLKTSFKNKTFLKFTFANMCIWYCFTTLLTIFPLYSTFVIGIEKESFEIGLALMLALVVAALSLPFHIRLRAKIGTRNALMLSLFIWIILLFPYVLMSDNPSIRPFFTLITALQGIPLGGALFYVDILIGDVIDADEIDYGVKRSASYYGVNAFVHRFSQIFSITTISLVFTGSGWAEYEPTKTIDIILGLKLIIFLFPAIALAIAITLLKLFELHGEKLQEMRKRLEEMYKNST
ncbi:MAG: MFS transporter [Promethearchaeia archaeon]